MVQNLLIQNLDFYVRKNRLLSYELQELQEFLTTFLNKLEKLEFDFILKIFYYKSRIFEQCFSFYSAIGERDVVFQRQIVKSAVFAINNNNLTTYLIILVILLSSFLLYFIKNKKKDSERIKIEKFLVPEEFKDQNNVKTGLEETSNDKDLQIKNSIVISDETLEIILKKLLKFENSEKFLRKDINLTWLSNHLNSNTRYVSEIIKIHKNQNFNSYINGLRIAYITSKLIGDPVYREYKISYLSEECGYASPQVFVIAFKKETGFTPSVFIENLKITALSQ